MGPERIYLSPPHIGELERRYVDEAFASNWIAPLGPHVDRFEHEFAAAVGCAEAAALSSGTAALHLGLRLLGVGPGDEVLVSSFTFVASVNPIRYLGADPILVDSETESWNLDPARLEEAIEDRMRIRGRPPAALVLVHLYGQCADLDPIRRICERHAIPLIEDAAEALGSLYKGRSPGGFGRIGIFSFNGNKIITTSGGGMLVTDDPRIATRTRKLATQAREPAPHYEHTEIGYNYRMSNVCAAIGRGQLTRLADRVEKRRRNFAAYRERLGGIDGLAFQPEAAWSRHTRWLTCLTIDRDRFGAGPAEVIAALEAENIEARPLWKPMHLQPLYRDCPVYGGAVSAELFRQGLCLPSGSALEMEDLERIAAIVAGCGRSC